jgi:hypothetical protein
MMSCSLEENGRRFGRAFCLYLQYRGLRQQVPLKRRQSFTGLESVTSQKTAVFSSAVVRTTAFAWIEFRTGNIRILSECKSDLDRQNRTEFKSLIFKTRPGVLNYSILFKHFLSLPMYLLTYILVSLKASHI